MSTVARPEFIVIDDVDSRIQYNGPWFADIGSHDSLGNDGPPFRSTLHGTQANASLEFTFHGGGLEVIGTNEVANGSTLECFIDGILTDAAVLDSSVGNGIVLCAPNTSDDGPHTLLVNATVMTNQTFWFDRIVYDASDTVPLDQETILFVAGDPRLQYGQGWVDGTTATPGSILNFDFIGVSGASISWYGSIRIGGRSSGAYSIDGQTPIDFVVHGTESLQVFFETAQLPAGPHTLKVEYQGKNNATELNLSYLIVQNGTRSSTATSVSSHAPSTTTGNGVSGTSTPGMSATSTTTNVVPSTSTPGKSSTTSTPLGTIVGGVIGGLTLIIFVILGLLLFRRCKRRAAEKKVLSPTPWPFDPEYTTLHPSSTTPNYPFPAQKSTLAIRKPSLTPQPVLRPSPLPLLSKAERQAEALATYESRRRGNTLPAMVSMQGNATMSPNVVAQENSGMGRMPPSTPATNVIMEVPPFYTFQ